MSRIEWILCERANRWAAALRTTLARRPASALAAPRLYEVRTIRDLSARLAERPHSVALIEVLVDCLDDTLSWLADAREHYPLAQFAALLDGALSSSYDRDAASAASRQLAVDALVEAGAAEVAVSPRHLDGVLALGRQHAQMVATLGITAEAASFREWTRGQLAWQDS